MHVHVVGKCHRLSMQLNCLTGLVPGIVSIVVTLPITCMFHTSALLSPTFLCSLRLALGQRLSRMYYISYCCLVVLFTALEGLLLLSRYIGIPVFTKITVMIPCSLLVAIVLSLTHCLVIPIGNGPYLLSLTYSTGPY